MGITKNHHAAKTVSHDYITMLLKYKDIIKIWW
jgi:hypothetical protein